MTILFVCTGNTCRSVMAEAIFNNSFKEHNITASSAGLSVIPNSFASQNSVEVLKDNIHVDVTKRKAVQLNEKLIMDSDLILTMTNYIRDVLVHYYPKYFDKIFTLNQYIHEDRDISDPYGGNKITYEKTFFELQNKINILINKIKEDNSI